VADYYRDRPSYHTLINEIDRKPEVLAHGKAGEAAFAIINRLDPEREVRWDIDIAGTHWDVMLNGCRVDAKTVSRLYPLCYLMWAVGKWPGEFERNDFDVLALMAGEGATFVWHGWVSKARFRTGHRIALGHRHLVDGTPYMEDHELEPPRVWPDIPT
jgi:hypothetical protein